MINCFVRALRRRRPSIRAEGLEALAEDKDFQVRSGRRPTGPWVSICKLNSGVGQFGNETPVAANCESGAANFSWYCNKVLEVTN
jgi:hypothetical protein